MGSEEEEALRAHRARVSALPLAKLTKDLVLKVMRKGIREADAEDLANRALILLIKKGATEWDHEADPTAWIYLLERINNARKADKKKAQRRQTDADSEAVDEAPPSSRRGPLGTVLDREQSVRARDELLKRLDKTQVPLAIAKLCIEEGELTPAEAAERLGLVIGQVYEAQRRISDEIEDIVRSLRVQDGKVEAKR